MPDYWGTIAPFCGVEVKVELLKAGVSNIQLLYESAFADDKTLAREIHAQSSVSGSCTKGHPLGIPLLSANQRCKICGGDLLIRGDHPSRATIYTETFGTVIGTHSHKYCKNYRKGCIFLQYYGYHSKGSHSITFYDPDWMQNSYFVSSSETVFEIQMLTKV